MEGTGAYGAVLARELRAEGVVVVEVDRPNRQSCAALGKSDPLDAYAAARAALMGGGLSYLGSARSRPAPGGGACLKWADVDLTAGRLTIRRNRQRPDWEHGCGGGACGRKSGHGGLKRPVHHMR